MAHLVSALGRQRQVDLFEFNVCKVSSKTKKTPDFKKRGGENSVVNGGNLQCVFPPCSQWYTHNCGMNLTAGLVWSLVINAIASPELDHLLSEHFASFTVP